MKKYLVVIYVVFFLQSCEDNKVVYKPESSARINSITVVVDNDNWNNTIGDKIRNLYADEYEGLPQIEERFTLKQMPYEAFSGFSRSSRNIIFIKKSSIAFVSFRGDFRILLLLSSISPFVNLLIASFLDLSICSNMDFILFPFISRYICGLAYLSTSKKNSGLDFLLINIMFRLDLEKPLNAS